MRIKKECVICSDRATNLYKSRLKPSTEELAKQHYETNNLTKNIICSYTTFLQPDTINKYLS